MASQKPQNKQPVTRRTTFDTPPLFYTFCTRWKPCKYTAICAIYSLELDIQMRHIIAKTLQGNECAIFILLKPQASQKIRNVKTTSAREPLCHF